MTYANLSLPAWELGRFSLGNLDGFHLGTWTVFTWELGRILLGNLDGFCLGTWTILLGNLDYFSPSICTYHNKKIHKKKSAEKSADQHKIN